MVFEIGGVVALVAIGCWLWALLECIVTPGSRCRTLPKVVWVLLIVLLPLFGTIGWFAFGRPRRETADRPAAGVRAPRRPNTAEESRPHVDAGAMSDRRSAELDRQLDAWEAEHARAQPEPDEH
jgi:hypothetical protein